MRFVPRSTSWRYWHGAAWACLVLGVATVWAADPPPKMDKIGDTPPPAQPAPAPKPPEKTIAFSMDKKPWGEVLLWLTDQTGLPLITQHNPQGTFTFIAPKGKQYTMPEIIDVLNESLIQQKYILIRRMSSFTIVPADVQIDPTILPRITLEDLDNRGNTEVVSVVYPLKSMNADELAPEVTKMMGPFGKVDIMSKSTSS